MQLLTKGFQPKEGKKAINSGFDKETIIVGKSIDLKRDEECSVPISKYNLNYVYEPKDLRDRKFSAVFKVDDIDLPSSVDLSPNWGEVYDQGELGSCVSNSVSGCIRYVRKMAKAKPFVPSRLYIYYYGRVIEESPPHEDTGLYIRDGYKSVSKYSVCSENNWGYDTSKFHLEPNENSRKAAKQHKKFEFLSVAHTERELKKCLAAGYPISFGFTVFSSFMAGQVAQTGIVPVPNYANEQQNGGHCVTLVGYNDDQGDDDRKKKCFKIINSWGNRWGDNGCCYMPYEMVLNSEFVSDFWTAKRLE